jgi:hypothetical protein
MNGYLKDTTGKVVRTVYGFAGAAPTGLTFVTCSDPTLIVVGAQAPAAYVGTIEATDSTMARACEDLIVALLAKGTIAKTDLASALITNVNTRRSLRGLAPV